MIWSRSTWIACPPGVSGVSRDCSGSVAPSWRRLAPPRLAVELAVETVAHAPDGGDGVAERSQLLAQTHDVRIHRAVEAVVVVAPELLQEEVAAERPAWMRGQQRQ